MSVVIVLGCVRLCPTRQLLRWGGQASFTAETPMGGLMLWPSQTPLSLCSLNSVRAVVGFFISFLTLRMIYFHFAPEQMTTSEVLALKPTLW